MAAAIETHDLRKTFKMKGAGKDVEAVRGIDLSVEEGEVFGFLGPNGAGKTTCQRMLSTLLPIGGGSASVGGFDVAREPGKVRKRIGYVSQLGGADLPATGRENLMLTGRLYGMKKSEILEKIDSLSRLLEIDGLLDRIVRTWSGGQKRRLEIAMGIFHEPQILFMDEPTTGLDPQNRANLWAHIRSLNKGGMTIFLTTHYLDEADALAGRLAIVDMGRIAALGSPDELKRQISGDVVRVRFRGQASAAALFGGLGFVNEIREADGDTFLYVKDGAKALPEIFGILKGKNIEMDALSLSEPSLDDVFLKKTGRQLRDTGKEGKI